MQKFQMRILRPVKMYRTENHSTNIQKVVHATLGRENKRRLALKGTCMRRLERQLKIFTLEAFHICFTMQSSHLLQVNRLQAILESTRSLDMSRMSSDDCKAWTRGSLHCRIRQYFYSRRKIRQETLQFE